MAQPHRIADRYEVSPLDRGGMANVWRGYDTVLDRYVAIKQIRPDRFLSGDQRRELAERFRREARITAKIDHPGVPAIYDAAIGQDPDDTAAIERLYLVMQLVHGDTLAELLSRRRQPLPVEWTVAIAAQICAVLSYAHALPVVHRDLKPSNVMVGRDGSVKVLDFGVAAVLGTDVTRLTATGHLIGSRDYMSPEQFLGVKVSPRSDLYALGCVLYEMLTGRKVFDSAQDPALQHVNDAPPPVRRLRPQVDEALERLVLDLLAKAPEDRPGTAQEVFDRLAPFLPAPQVLSGGDASGAAAATGPDEANAAGPAAASGDPTRPFRFPFALRRYVQPTPPSPPSVPRPRTAPDVEPPPELLAGLGAAQDRATALIEEDRFTQAVRILDDALDSARTGLPADHPQVWELRESHAAALVLGGDYRQARHAFVALAADYARVLGPDHPDVRACRLQIAYCDAELGDTDAALAGFRALLDGAVRRDGTRSVEALELREQIGDLLLAAQRRADAVRWLRPLREDLLATGRPPDDSTVRRIDDLLTRIDLTGGS